jgi:uncharacterized membrane protein
MGLHNEEAPMADRPVFLYAAAYASAADARLDYEVLLDAHAVGLVGTYDAAVIERSADGKVHVHKREKPTQHGAWTGAAVGALVGAVFPPAIIGSAVVGAAAGGTIGHFRKGMSRSELKEIGELLDGGEAALIVIGESKVREELEKELRRATRISERELDAEADELRRELDEASKAESQA